MIYSNNICDVIGNDPIVDQNDVELFLNHRGTYLDAVVTGSFLVYSASGEISTSERGRVLSNVYVNAADSDTSVPRLSADDFVTSLVPTREIRRSYRFVDLYDNKERFWDTLLPSLSDVWKTDGVNVYDSFLCSHTHRHDAISGFVSSSRAAVFYMGYLRDPWEISFTESGGMLNAVTLGSAFDYNTLNMSNYDWPKAYPWEARYSSLSRQQTPLKSILTTMRITDWSANPVTQTAFQEYRQSAFISIHGDRDEVIMLSLTGPHRFGINARGWYNSNVPLAEPPPSIDQFGSMFTDESEFVKVAYGYSTRSSRQPGTCVHLLRANSTVEPVDVRYRGGMLTFSGSSAGAPGLGRHANEWFKHCIGVTIEGWKYGIINGYRQVSKSVFSRNHYGQYRDMLEQRIDGKFFYETADGREYTDTLGTYPTTLIDRGRRTAESTVTTSPVQVKFVATDDTVIDPGLTTSSNQSFEATSSLPYFDGEVRNRGPIDWSLIDVVMVTP